MTSTATITAKILRATDWSTMFSGEEFRVVVLQVCPSCNVAEAHAVELLETPGEAKCQICLKVAIYAVPTLITIHQERAAHNAECKICRYANQTGRNCSVGQELWAQEHKMTGRGHTPFMVRRVRKCSAVYTEYRTYGAWTLREAKALASVHGGELIDLTHIYKIAE